MAGETSRESIPEPQFQELFERIDELNETVAHFGGLEAAFKDLSQAVAELDRRVSEHYLLVETRQVDEPSVEPLETATVETTAPASADAGTLPLEGPVPEEETVEQAGFETEAEPEVVPVLPQPAEPAKEVEALAGLEETAPPLGAGWRAQPPTDEPHHAEEGAPPERSPAFGRLGEILGGVAPAFSKRLTVARPDLRALGRRTLKFLTGFVTLVRVGILILILGLAFLIQFATSQGWLAIELRLAGAALIGIVLTGIGWRLRSERRNYALTLQGGGIGILYLIVFASLQLYHLVPATPAFAMLVLIAVFSALLAVAQNASSLAVLGVLGGFFAPFLASSGVVGDHVALFSYYLVLNLGVMVVSWFRAWRHLNLLGFTLTFLIGVFWGSLYYRPELFATTEPFLIAFFVFYLAMALLYAFRHDPDLRRVVDSVLVLGLPVVAFSLQVGLVRRFEYGLAWSAFALALSYLGLAWILARQTRARFTSLIEAFVIVGLIFTTLVLPFALDATWTGAGWALEGAGLLWFGLRRERRWLRASGVTLLVASVVSLLLGQPPFAGGDALTTDSFAWSAIVIGVAGLAAAYGLRQFADRLGTWEHQLERVFLPFGLFWWSLGGLALIVDIWRWEGVAPNAFLLYLTATALACSVLGHRWQWRAFGLYPLGLLPLMIVVQASVWWDHPFANLGWFAWPAALTAYYWILHRSEGLTTSRKLGYAHLGTLWFVTLLGARETGWLLATVMSDGSRTWALVGAALTPILVILIVSQPRIRQLAWLRAHQQAYLDGLTVVGLVLGAWLILTNLGVSGDATPLPFVPILNPLDLGQAFGLIALVVGFRRYRVEKDLGARWHLGFTLTMLGLMTLWLSAAVFRTVHHWLGVPFDFAALFASSELQTALAILWSGFALAFMVYATRSRQRAIWLVGQSLLWLVVLKLFVIDLAKIGTVTRIISFVVVGLLLLLIAYLTPVPPRETEASEQMERKVAG